MSRAPFFTASDSDNRGPSCAASKPLAYRAWTLVRPLLNSDHVRIRLDYVACRRAQHEIPNDGVVSGFRFRCPRSRATLKPNAPPVYLIASPDFDGDTNSEISALDNSWVAGNDHGCVGVVVKVRGSD